MPRIIPKSIVINLCDDLFDTEDEGEGTSEEEYTSNGIKKSELVVGTHVFAKDSGVNDIKYGSDAGKEAYPAFVVEPGISDDGSKIWISWTLEKEDEKKTIPLENIEKIVPFHERSMRKRNTLKLPMTLPGASPNRRTGISSSVVVTPSGSENSVSPYNPRKKYKSNSNSINKAKVSSVPRPIAMNYHGEPVEIFETENDSDLYYLKFIFGDNLKIKRGDLNGELQQLEKTITKYGVDFHLIVSKLKKTNTYMKPQYEKTNKDKYVSYYLGGPGFETVADVKRKLEELGDFSEIAQNYGKMCARLELMVSPTCSQYPSVFRLKYDEFELIEENQNVGCGFASPDFFEKLLEQGPRSRKFKDIFAIQIRIFCPKLGWFKGMLMKKPSITGVQLPNSMMKVQQSRSPNCSNDAYLLVKQIFPNKGSIGVRTMLEGKKEPTKTALKRINQLKFSYIVLLESHGVSQDDWKEYEQTFYDHDKGKAYRIRNDDHIVGVADPTSSLPYDSVFVTGFKANHCGDKVFITRYPCTEKADGKLLKVVTSRPNGMSSEDWKYLASIPYGILVFGPSSTSTSLPEQIADGDLDGDTYHILWDFTIVKKIEEFHSRNINNMTSSFESSESHHHNNVARDIMLKNPGVYDDSRLRHRDDDEPVVIRAVLDIIGHHKGEIKVLWDYIADKKIVEAWEQLKDIRNDNEITETVAQYGLDNKLEDQLGWKWIKEYDRVTELTCIVSHKEDNGKMTFVANYDTGRGEELTLNETKEEVPDLLYKYANENNLLHQWRTEYIAFSKGNWFENAQNYSAELKHLYYESKLMKAIHREWKKRVINHDTEAADALSQAYKNSLDYRKHAALVSLPIRLTNCLPKNLRHCVIPT